MASQPNNLPSRSAKKRKGKVDTAVEPSSPGSEPPQLAPPGSHANGADIPGDGPYIKELSKKIRNVHKKLSASSKADAVIADNPGISLDDLVSSKKLNNDQKTQILNKPGLQSQLAQLEDQLSQYRSFAQEIEERHNREKAALVESHQGELERVKEEITKEAQNNGSQSLEEGLKVISHFLHAAASKRQSDDAESEEGRAFEGALLLVYQGNEASLSTLKNLIEGSEEKVTDVQGDLLDFSFAQVRKAALEDARDIAQVVEEDDVEVEEPVAFDTVNDSEDIVVPTDPTLAHATLTELEDTTTAGPNGTAEPEAIIAPEQSSTTADAANAIAETSWDPQASMTTEHSATEEWVQVPRDPAETDNGIAATPAAMHGSSSWAEEVGAAASEVPKQENDGFEQVRRERGRGRGRGTRGDFRGRGRGTRGDGGRGGRGAGGSRGGRGGLPRGDKS